MSYAVRNDGLGWRAISGESDLLDGESFSIEQPALITESLVPAQVTRAQGKAALIRQGLWQGVLDFVSAIEDPVEKAVAEVALHDTANWQRTSPFLNAAVHAIGLTDAQLDDLFIQAAQIEL